jgi:hypothetical protein
MPVAHQSKHLRQFCHEHLLEMRLNRSSLNNGGDATRATTYGCTKPDCLVRYNPSRGYFMLSQNGNRDEMDVLAKVRCFLDGAPLYLAEISPEKRSFRLWTCPQCGARRTNEEGLAGLTSQEIQDLGGENTAQSEPAGTPHI